MASPTGINKTLYERGSDRRMNLYDAQNLDDVRKQARSVGCLMHQGYLKSADGGFRLQHAKSIGERRNFQKGENFYHELVAATGTIFLVASDLAFTAAHCVCVTGTDKVDVAKNKQNRIVFDFQMTGDGQCQQKFDADDVYSIRKVVAYRHYFLEGRSLDWALVKLDRPVKGREPLDLDFQTELVATAPVDMIGHPSGLPRKYTYGAHIQKADHADYVEADLDAFGGNSGSPVFIDRKVGAILVRGLTDYVTVTTAEGVTFMQPHLATESETRISGYEKCTRLSVIDITTQMYIQAAKGNSEDQFQLGLHYLQINMPKKGVSRLQKAAYSGHPQAIQKLGELYACQLGTPAADQQLVSGLSFEAVCTADRCELKGNRVYIAQGMVDVDVKRTFYDLKCPTCTNEIDVTTITSLLFWDCQFTLDGRAHPNTVIKHTEKAKGQNFKQFPIDSKDLIYLNTKTI